MAGRVVFNFRKSIKLLGDIKITDHYIVKIIVELYLSMVNLSGFVKHIECLWVDFSPSIKSD